MKNLFKKIKKYEINDRLFDKLYYTLLFLIMLLLVLMTVDDDQVDYKNHFQEQGSQHQPAHPDYKELIKSTYPIYIEIIKNELFNIKGYGNGTAFFYKEDIILTNAHNVISSDDMKINDYILNIYGGKVEVELLRYDERSDIAALRTIDYKSKNTIDFCDSDFKIGEEIASFGYGAPFHTNGLFKTGYKNTSNQAFSFEGNKYNYTNSITSLDIAPGDSGSPVIKAEDKCFAGIVNAGNNDRRIAMVVSHHNIRKFLTELDLLLYTE